VSADDVEVVLDPESEEDEVVEDGAAASELDVGVPGVVITESDVDPLDVVFPAADVDVKVDVNATVVLVCAVDVDVVEWPAVDVPLGRVLVEVTEMDEVVDGGARDVVVDANDSLAELSEVTSLAVLWLTDETSLSVVFEICASAEDTCTSDQHISSRLIEPHVR
jgi:hypothetical protein